jgi:hypothetical protein
MGEIWLENARIAVTRDALGEDRMGRKLIDISAALRAGIKSDPPANLPEIEYSDHHQTAPPVAITWASGSTSCRMASTALRTCAHLDS